MKTAQNLRFEFVSGISTELKEPLNVLIGFAELLLHQYFGILNEKQLEYCQCILGASNQLHLLINNLLEMVSIDIDSITLDLSTFFVEEAIDEVIASVDKRAKEKNIDIFRNYSDEKTIFYGDKTRIKQAIFNILINALQFTPPNGKIDIRVVYDNDNIKIIVKDEGIGFPRNEKKKVFKRSSNNISFFNTESNSISMPLVRSLIELHNGTLHISSDTEEGTSVVCSLPIKSAEIGSGENINDKQNNFVNFKKVVNS